MKKIYIDVETTGLDPAIHTIWQLSGMVEIDGEKKEQFDWIFKPSRFRQWDRKVWCNPKLISTETKTILELPGTNNSVFVFHEFVDLLDRFVDKYKKADRFWFYGYNAHFDWEHLWAFFKLHQNDYCGSYFFFPPIDVAQKVALLLAYRREEMPDLRLTTVAKELGIEVDEEKAHDGMYDIVLTKKIDDRWLPSDLDQIV